MERQSRKYKNDYRDVSYRWQDELTTLSIEQWKKEIAYQCSPFTVTKLSVVLDLIDTVENIILNDIPGDFVECGVFMGGSCMIMAEVLKHYKQERDIWMYDTFSGVPIPEANELTKENENLRDWYVEQKVDSFGNSNWCYSSLQDVKQNFAECNYLGQVRFIEGIVEDTIPANSPVSIALLRIDVDLAKPTRHVLNHFYPKLVKNGHLILDDYGHFPMVKATVDDYFKNDSIKLAEINYTVRHMIK